MFEVATAIHPQLIVHHLYIKVLIPQHRDKKTCRAKKVSGTCPLLRSKFEWKTWAKLYACALTSILCRVAQTSISTSPLTVRKIFFAEKEWNEKVHPRLGPGPISFTD